MELPFEVREVIYYAVVYSIGFLSGVSQTVRDRGADDCRNSITVGFVSGFLAFSIVTFIDGPIDDASGDVFYYFGIAALVGLSAKYQDIIIQNIWRELSRRFSINDALDDRSQQPQSTKPKKRLPDEEEDSAP
jgi:hypothetical protein